MLTSWNSVTLFQIVQPDLDNMCFATFIVHYTVSLYSKIVAKKGKQSLQIPRFSPDFKSVKNTPHYYKSCWYSLLIFKPWSDYCGTLLLNDVAMNSCFDITNAPEELQNDIISSWESFLIDPINVDNANDDLMRQVDRFQHEMHLNEDGEAPVSPNGDFSAADDQPDFNHIFRNVTDVIDDDSETVQWNTEFDFNIPQNHYESDENLPINLKLKHTDIIILKNPMIRVPIYLDGLKSQQKNAVITFLHLCGVMKDANNQFLPQKRMPNSTIPNAMIITGTAGTGKSFTIDAMITELLSRLEEKNINDMEVLVLAPTGRAAMQAKGFTLHCAEGLSVPILVG